MVLYSSNSPCTGTVQYQVVRGTSLPRVLEFDYTRDDDLRAARAAGAAGAGAAGVGGGFAGRTKSF